MAPAFSLSITVTAKSGAYLADSHIKTTWLREGTTSRRCTKGAKQQRSVNIAANMSAKISFSFDVPVDRALEKAPNN